MGILEVQGGDERFAIGWNWLPVLSEALDISGGGVLNHFSGLGQRPPISDAAGQCRHEGGESTFGFRAEDNVEMVVYFPHSTPLLYLIPDVRSIKGARS